MTLEHTAPNESTMRAALDAQGSASRRVWIGGRHAIVVPCSIEMEQTRDTLHAHVSLEGLDVDYGDEVLIHAAPTHLEFGERLVTTSQATVVRASALGRLRVKMMSYLQLTELYECGFQPLDEVVLRPVNSVRPATQVRPSTQAKE